MPESDQQEPSEEGATPDPGKLGDGGRKALEAERKARRDAEKKVTELEAALQEIADRDKSASEKQAEQITSLKAELAKATLSTARFRVALQSGLSETQAKRLVGDTEEELTADAEQLVQDLGLVKSDETVLPASGPVVDLKPGSGDPDDPIPETDPEKLAASVPRGY